MKVPSLSRLMRLFHSVFTKLLVISLATWLCILVATISVFVISRHGNGSPFARNLSIYAEYIIRDIGVPPDLNKAQLLAKDTGLHISFISEGQRWSTRPVFPEIESLRFRSLHGDTSMQFSRRSGHHIFRHQTGAGVLFLEFSRDIGDNEQATTIPLLLFSLLSLILLCSYLAIRRVLAPLKWFNIAVHKVKEGDLSHQVPIRGNDELTDIAGGFNEMTTQLRIMLENKENLLRDVSHELRTPLTRIRVALEFLEKSRAKEDISQDILAMEEMIKGILETARQHHKLSQRDFVILELTEIIQSVTTRYQGSKPVVVFEAPKEHFPAAADEKLIRSVISNCIDNALKFSVATSSPIILSIKKESGHAVITIADSGCGIEETELPFIFEPFYRIDSSRSTKTGGYGLGLAICKAIMEVHGGKIVAKSSKGQGTTIEISLPLQEKISLAK